MDFMSLEKTAMTVQKQQMKISFKPLWKILIDKDMRKQDLRIQAGLSASTVAKLGRDENVTTSVLVRICNVLNCDLDQICTLIPADDV